MTHNIVTLQSAAAKLRDTASKFVTIVSYTEEVSFISDRHAMDRAKVFLCRIDYVLIEILLFNMDRWIRLPKRLVCPARARNTRCINLLLTYARVRGIRYVAIIKITWQHICELNQRVRHDRVDSCVIFTRFSKNAVIILTTILKKKYLKKRKESLCPFKQAYITCCLKYFD